MQSWVNIITQSIRNKKFINVLNQQYIHKFINIRNISTTKSITELKEDKLKLERPHNNEKKSNNKKYIKRIIVSIGPQLADVSKSHLITLPHNNLNKDSVNDIVRLRKVLPRDAPNVIKLFQKSFTKCEPMANCLDIPEKPLFCPILKEFWLNSIRQGMTYAAIPSDSVSIEYLYGAVLNTRLTQLEPDHWWLYSKCSSCPKTKSLLNLWSFIVKDSAIHQICATKKILNIAHIIINEQESKKINPKFDHMNLANVLISKSFRIASSKGYKMVSIMCSSATMCEVATRLNMEKIYEKSYKNIFENNFHTNFKNIIPNLSLKIFTKKI